MKQSPTLNATATATPDAPDFREQQVTLLIAGTPPTGSQIALERQADGSDLFLPLTIDGAPVVFTPDYMDNDTVLITMKVKALRFVPNATFTAHTESFFGFKIVSRR